MSVKMQKMIAMMFLLTTISKFVSSDNKITVVPNQIQRNTHQILALTIDQLPLLEEDLVCAFTIVADQLTVFTNATRSPNGVNCPTPLPDLLAEFTPGKHDLTTQLSVRTMDGPDLVSTSFTFFDCSTHTSCTQCVSSQFPCDWCLSDGRCVHNSAEKCPNDEVTMGVGRDGPSHHSGPGFCPTIHPIGGEGEISVVSGTSKSIKVEVKIRNQFVLQTRLVCQFNIDGHLTRVNAQLLGDTIYCDSMEFVNTSKSPNLTATFDLLWGQSRPFDNPDNIHVVIY